MFLINLLLCWYASNYTELFTTCFPDKHYHTVVIIGLNIAWYDHHIYSVLYVELRNTETMGDEQLAAFTITSDIRIIL